MSNLAALLKNRGKTLSDLARALEVDKSTITRWNAGGVPPKRIPEVVEASGIAACDLDPELARAFQQPREAAQ